MSIILSDPTTLQGLYEDVKFKSGLDALAFEHFVRLANFALDDYAHIRLTASGRVDFDDSTHVNNEGDRTLSIATATLQAGETSIPLDADMLTFEEVRFNGAFLTPIDRRDFYGSTLTSIYGTSGTPRAYDYRSHSLFLYPPPSTGGTVTILYGRASPYFTTTDTDAPIGIPRIHHKYLSLNIRSQLNEAAPLTNAADIERKLLIEEEEIRDFASKQDQSSPRRLKAKINVPK